MTTYAIAQQSGVDEADRVRIALSGLLPDTAALKSRSGFLDGGAVVTLTSGMSCQVSPFRAFIQGGTVDTQGGYLIVSDANEVRTFDDGDASNRTDLLVARVYHDTYDASGFTKAQVEIVKGTPGGGTPAVPAGAIKVAEKVITAGMSAGTGGLGTVPVDKRPPRLVANGGLIPVANQADRDALPARKALMVYRLDTDTIEVNTTGDGTGWKPVPTGYKPLPFVAAADIPTPLSGAWGDVTGFTFAAEAGAVYGIDVVAFLLNPSASAPKWKHGWTWSGTGEMSAGQSGLDVSVVSPNYAGTNTGHAFLADNASPLQETTGLAAPAGVGVVARVHATFFSTTANTVQLRHAQFTSDPTYATKFAKGSRMRVERIG